MTGSRRAALEEIFRAAVAAAHPGALVRQAVESLLRRLDGSSREGRIWIIALGKAAPEMARVAADLLRRRSAPIAGGVVVGTRAAPSPHAGIEVLAGDHPVPGARSLAAAEAVGRVSREVGEHDAVLVLVSGGATSLVGAPAHGVEAPAIPPLFDALLRSGWDISAMNAVRKRFIRWGAGRVAGALAPAIIQPAFLSDVIGDDPAVIASGPCTPDPLTAAEVRDRLDALRDLIPAGARDLLLAHLDDVAGGRIPETPKPGDRSFASVLEPIVHGNATAIRGAADCAARLGWRAVPAARPLAGEAAACGARLAAALLAGTSEPRPLCFIHGGETTVSLGAAAAGAGGRCQELALSGAGVLDGAYEGAAGIALLAAGTDGRDGPTDAAGAVVDRESWRLARAAGRDPAADLARHDSHAALDAAGALLRTGDTGTNVMDIVVGVVNAPG